MADLLLIETGSGGDLIFRGSDLVGCEDQENQPYLSMFSGEGWWGNDLLLGSQVFSSQTERVAAEVAMNSAGRVQLEAAIRADLAHLEKESPGTTVSVSTLLISADRLHIAIAIGGEQFYFSFSPDSGFSTYSV